MISGSLLYPRAGLHIEQVLKTYLSNDIMGIRLRQMDFLYLLGSKELLFGQMHLDIPLASQIQ